MQKLAEICIKRPVFAAMIILALVVVGAASYFRLGVDRFPSFDLPNVSVRTSLPGGAPEEVESEVSQKIEEAVNTVEGIEELRSISAQGNSIVFATFNLNRDIDTAAQDVRDRVASVIRDLPRDVDPPIVNKFNNDSSAVMTVALSADRSVRELTELADKLVKPVLERSTGVGEIDIVGGLGRAINVWVDADRLAAYQLPISTVRNAIVRQNADAPGGNVTLGNREQSLRTMGRVADPKIFNDLVVATINGAPVHIRDIGYAEDGTKEQRSVARLNGIPTVTIEVRRQTGTNTVEVIEAAKGESRSHSRATSFRRQNGGYPRSIAIHLCRAARDNASPCAGQHSCVAGGVWRSCGAGVLPSSLRSRFPHRLIATFGMMRALNFTLNSVTMLALVLMVGVVIDDAIVVLENIFRFVEEKKMHPWEAARAATAEIGLAVMATTFSLVVIFVPVSFMSSISGRFLYQFGITAAVAILVSLLVSFTLTPMMSARLLSGG